MKTLIQNTVSFFEKRFEACQLSAPDSTCDAIVSGYSYFSKINRQKLLPGNCNRRLVGILYADIAGYARLTEEDEEGTHHQLIEGMKIMRACVAATQGKVAHFAGDAILVEFSDADSALRCAVNVQLAARQWNSYLDPIMQVRFRIGINYGEVISDQGDIYDKAANLAARLEGLAHSGGICISDSVRAKLRNQSSFKFIGLGKRYVKNISTPVEAFWIEFNKEQIVDPNLFGMEKLSMVAL